MLFVLFIMLFLMLLVLLLVFILFMLSMVSFWCLESVWLCVVCRLAEYDGGVDVVFVVDYVVIDVVCVVVCVGCDEVSYGEVLVRLVLVAGWSSGCGVLFLVV